jgi:hypothetical protein
MELRKIFGPKKDENTGWRKFHNEELHNFYSPPIIIGMTMENYICRAFSTQESKNKFIQNFYWKS